MMFEPSWMKRGGQGFVLLTHMPSLPKIASNSCFWPLWDLSEPLERLLSTVSRSFEDICLWQQGACLTSGVVRYFGTTADFNAISSEQEILAKVNVRSFPDGGGRNRRASACRR